LRCGLRTTTACDASVSARYLLWPRRCNATGSQRSRMGNTILAPEVRFADASLAAKGEACLSVFRQHFSQIEGIVFPIPWPSRGRLRRSRSQARGNDVSFLRKQESRPPVCRPMCHSHASGNPRGVIPAQAGIQNPPLAAAGEGEEDDVSFLRKQESRPPVCRPMCHSCASRNPLGVIPAQAGI